MSFEQFDNPWAVGGAMHRQLPWVQASQEHGWGHGNDYFQPKTKDQIRKEALLQLAILAVVVAAPAVVGAIGGAGAGTAAAGTGVGLGTSGQAAGSVITQGTVAATGGLGAATSGAVSAGAGAVSTAAAASTGAAAASSALGISLAAGAAVNAAMQPFLDPQNVQVMQAAAGRGNIATHLKLASGFEINPSPFPWQGQFRPLSLRLLEGVAEQLAKNPKLRQEIHSHRPGNRNQAIERMVVENLSDQVLASGDPPLPNLPTHPDTGGLIPESWWKGKSFGRGFIAGMVNGASDLVSMVWELMQLNIASPYIYYDWIFEGGDTSKGTWEKTKLFYELATDSELRNAAAENITLQLKEWWGDVSFQDGAAEAGYQYGTLFIDLLAALLTEGGWTAKRIISALKSGGSDLKKLLSDAFNGAGSLNIVSNSDSVFSYIANLAAEFKDDFIRIFRGRNFNTTSFEMVGKIAFETYQDITNQVLRIALWYISVPPAFRGTGHFRRWLLEAVKKAKLHGLKKVEIDVLNIGNPDLHKFLRSLELEGWQVEVFESVNGSPTIKLIKIVD